MKNIDQHFLDNLIKDQSFINWIKKSNRNDIQYWNSWISNNPEQIETIELAKSIVLGIRFKETVIAEEKIDIELQKALGTIQSKTKPVLPFYKQKKSFAFYGIAASILMIFGLFIGLDKYNYNTTTVHKTAFGEIINLTLPDGTSVVLNGNSTISYDKENSRDINLIGEAYFKVKPIPATKAKFWVTTNDLKVEVYGTQFHVNTRDEKTDVVLDEGSIHLVLDNGITKKMIPGEFVSFSKNTENITHKKVNLQVPYGLWRDGTYIFNNLTLKEVMKNMEYTYGITTNFDTKELEKKLISGGIPNKNLKICLAAIEKSANVNIIQNNDTLTITNNN
ncbi:FecR family protein [Maribacter vaceletii]|uniref:FecR family protein n=1 Tax=Maribacter vaceletii TaxID=1206816 RepID=A0A495E8S9_9FLAO|nr:FecR family protein [Maribacter vaceletii]RKR12893.1 FecR family protein [Maribacter vaceletii]